MSADFQMDSTRKPSGSHLEPHGRAPAQRDGSGRVGTPTSRSTVGSLSTPLSNTSSLTRGQLEAQIVLLRRALYECYILSGADTSADAAHGGVCSTVDDFEWWRLKPEWAVDAVRELREDYNECLDELPWSGDPGAPS